MAITPTRLDNIIIPEIWEPQVIERSTQLSELWTSGIVQEVAELAGFVASGGNIVNLPYWQDLQGRSELVSATGLQLSVNPIQAAQDAAAVFARGKAWGTNNLAAALSGGNPQEAIRELVAGWWARDMDTTVLYMLKGVFAASTMSSNILDISAAAGDAARVNGSSFIDATQRLGDAKSKITGIIMHSAVEAAFAKLPGQLDYVNLSAAEPRVPFLQGKRVIVTDQLPTSGSGTDMIFDTYLFGAGAFGYANGNGSRVTKVSTDEDKLADEEYLINRRHFVLHPRGVRFIGTTTAAGPTDAELQDGTSWERVYDPKNVRMIAFRHKI
jgi:hypothetical protein